MFDKNETFRIFKGQIIVGNKKKKKAFLLLRASVNTKC